MSAKWIFALVNVLFALNSFSSEIEFTELLKESRQAQLTLAAQLQDQLGIENEKTLKSLTASDAVSSEGFNIKIKKLVN
jgi:hypothetical protein